MRTLMLFACALHAGAATAGDAGPTGAPAWTPTAEEAAVHQVLSLRDAIDCAQAEALAADPVAVLTVLAEKVQAPPWVAVRAAHCLASRHAEAAKPVLLAWLGDRERLGLALAIAGDLDGLDEPLALELARAGLAGPNAQDLRRRFDDSVHPSIRALVVGP